MTATTFKESNECKASVEKSYIENMQIKIFDSLIVSMIDTATEPIRTSYDAFLDIHRNTWPKIIYCPEKYADKHGITSYDDLFEKAEDFTVVCDTPFDYRKLLDRHIYIIKEEQKTRGVDF